jgi:hypothetical protein
MTTALDNAKAFIDLCLAEQEARTLAESLESLRQWPELAAHQDMVLQYMMANVEEVRRRAYADAERQLQQLGIVDLVDGGEVPAKVSH